jgi:hypothetical protein
MATKDKRFWIEHYVRDREGFFDEPCPVYSDKFHQEIWRLKEATLERVKSFAVLVGFEDKSKFEPEASGCDDASKLRPGERNFEFIISVS